MGISSIGLGSGLEVETIVKQLVALESKPITSLQTKASGINTQISAYSQLKSQIANLQEQVTLLTKNETWIGKTVTSGSTGIVTGTATIKAVTANYDVVVKQMASVQAINSGVVQTSSSLGSGSLTITMGEWKDDQLAVNTKDGAPVQFTVDIADSDDSLSKIAAKINAANGGVTATVLRDHNGERLTLQSRDTGANAAFSVAVNQTAGSGLSQLAYDGTNSALGMSRSLEAQDTLATVNGIQMASRNAKFEEIAEGVTLTVSKKMQDSDAPVRVTISNDATAGKAALKNLVESYNALSSALVTMTAYDKDSKSAGSLQGDSSAINLQSALRRILSGPGGANDGFTSLTQMGLTFQKDGSLKIDDTKLDKALTNPQSMAKFFAVDVEDADQDGMAVRLKDFTTGLLSVDGMFATKDSTFKDALKRNSSDQERLGLRVAAYETRLRAQYTRLDSTMASLSALDTYITQQVASWNKSSS